jgi:hypothetical protein
MHDPGGVEFFYHCLINNLQNINLLKIKNLTGSVGALPHSCYPDSIRKEF